MSSSAADIQTKIDSIDTQIDILIAAPDEFVSYQEGNRRISKKDKLDGLISLRAHYVKLLREFPAEYVEDNAYGIDRYGRDTSEYIGDDESGLA